MARKTPDLRLSHLSNGGQHIRVSKQHEQAVRKLLHLRDEYRSRCGIAEGARHAERDVSARSDIDVGSDNVLVEEMFRGIESERNILSRINEAIGRVHSHAYGLCTGCYASIPVARLNAIPYVERCIACTAKEEKNQPRFIATQWTMQHMKDAEVEEPTLGDIV
jgi:RNA polymerase-binding transcription factor DksA